MAAEKARKRIQAEKIKEQAKKSHKERVAEYNDYLANLSEHHDIPRVRPRILIMPYILGGSWLAYINKYKKSTYNICILLYISH